MPEVFFPRGDGPLVSVLIPTRGRPQLLCNAIDSIFSLAKYPQNIELILKVDDDDEETIFTAKLLEEKLLRVKVLISPRGRGYHDLHLWVNQMAEIAKGDWLFLFNDDAKICTQDWDSSLLNIALSPNAWHGVVDICCFAIPTKGDEYSEQFMFLRRKVVELLGHYTLIPHVDTWMKTLMRSVNSIFHFPFISVEHMVEFVDKVKEESVDARETLIYTTKAKGLNYLKLQDALKLQGYIDEKQSTYNFVTVPQNIVDKFRSSDADATAILALFAEPPNSTVLEVGSHDVPIANILADLGFKVVGVDLREYCPVDPNSTEEKPPCNYTYIRADFCDCDRLFFKENSLPTEFDSVISVSAIEHFGLCTYNEGDYHLTYDIIAMHRIWELLKDGGTAYICVPFGGEYIENVPHWRVYNQHTLKTRIVQDFVIETSFFFVAADCVINGRLCRMWDIVTFEEVSSFSGHPPHVSIALKLRKRKINRLAPDGR